MPSSNNSVWNYLKLRLFKPNVGSSTIDSSWLSPDIGSGGSGNVARYSSTFTDSDLSIVGILVKVHSLGVRPTAIHIVDPNGETVDPDEWAATTTTVSVDLSILQPLIPGLWEIHLF